MAEGSETPGEPPRSTDRDLLAERRARRAVDADPTDPADALTRRAEAAEATVQTLETHLASLQQRMQEAAEERALLSGRLDSEQAAVAEGEHELRRVKQREYAEQQLRVEAEDRRTQLERDSRAEIDRLHVLRDVIGERISAREAAQLMRVTPRQVFRLLKVYRADGPSALLSKRRGKPSNRSYPSVVRTEALALIKANYTDFGPTLATEKLAERHGLCLGVETVRRWMLAEGLWSRMRKRKAHRKRRDEPRRMLPPVACRTAIARSIPAPRTSARYTENPRQIKTGTARWRNSHSRWHRRSSGRNTSPARFPDTASIRRDCDRVFSSTCRTGRRY